MSHQGLERDYDTNIMGIHSVCQDHWGENLTSFMGRTSRMWIALVILAAAILLWHLLPLNGLGRRECAEANGILEDLAEGRIASVSIFYLPSEALTSLPFTPEALMGAALVHRSFPMDRQLEASLFVALTEPCATPSFESPDLRWGAQLFDSEGRVAHSIFLSGGGWPTRS